MRRLRFMLPGFIAAAALAAPGIAHAAECAGADVHPSAADTETVREATLCLLNNERTARGLPKLRPQPTLHRVSSSYARLMVRQGFFSHVSPGGSTLTQRIKRTGYLKGVRAWSVGENLAWGVGESATPRAIVAAWMDSPGHRANILSRSFREIGIGVTPGSPRIAGAASTAATYVTHFGMRKR